MNNGSSRKRGQKRMEGTFINEIIRKKFNNRRTYTEYECSYTYFSVLAHYFLDFLLTKTRRSSEVFIVSNFIFACPKYKHYAVTGQIPS